MTLSDKLLYQISIVTAIGFLLCLLVLNPLHRKNIQSYNQKQKDQPPLLTCIYCKGTGERIEDANRIIFMAKVQLYLNKHLEVDKCTKCVKMPETGNYIYCDEANNQYSTFLQEYGAVGPKMEKTICSKCMGAGQFQILSKNPKTNKWYTQKDYEQDEKTK